MKWFVVKIVYRIICGDGNHKAQFDEQLRLISAGDEKAALEKAKYIGREEQETFYNDKKQPVQWLYINVSELHMLIELIDGAELYSKIQEAGDAEGFVDHTHRKAEQLEIRFNLQKSKILI